MALALGGCVLTNRDRNTALGSAMDARRDAASVEVMADTPVRAYRVLGEVAVTVRRGLRFTPNPTREQVVAALQEEAAAAGADAVIDVVVQPVRWDLSYAGYRQGAARAVVWQ
ncbi:MAG: hypothetical protein V4653_20980 [Pseudomonadota bacterium]